MKELSAIKPWIASITNHLYWCVMSTPVNGALVLAKWLSILEHMQDKHSDFGEPFPACLHGALNGRERRKKWIKPGN